jgi:hypothetical protein
MKEQNLNKLIENQKDIAEKKDEAIENKKEEEIIEKKDEIIVKEEENIIKNNDDLNNKEDNKEDNKKSNKEDKTVEKKEEMNQDIINDDNNIMDNINIDMEKAKNNKNIKDNPKKDIEDINDILSNAKFEEMKNYIGIVTNETIFEYLVFNYYSNEMKEFNLSLNEMLLLGDIPLIEKLTNKRDMKEKAYNTFNNYLFGQSDIIPIFNENEIEGFIYPKDFLYYIYNCESRQSLTNEEFLIHLYRDIDEEKPYGKNRIIYMELNDINKGFYVKELFEKLDCSIEKKIVIYDPNYNNKLYLMSLKTIFKAIVEFQLNNNK